MILNKTKQTNKQTKNIKNHRYTHKNPTKQNKTTTTTTTKK